LFFPDSNTSTSTVTLGVFAAISRKFLKIIQFVALFNNGLLFVEISRRRIRAIVERLTAPDITTAEILEAGEDLSMLLGQSLEAKIRGKIILDILKDLG
jgi:hypothetical protein